MLLLGYRVAPHHLAFIRFWESLEARGVLSGLLLGPRGCGKSTVCDICDATLEALCDRSSRILIASRTSDQARAFLGAIKGNLEKPQITEIFGELIGDKWDEEI